MKTLIMLMAFCIPCFADYDSRPLPETAKIEQDILDGRLGYRTEKALNFVIMTAAGELRKKGYKREASEFENEWFNTYQHSFRAFVSSERDIGDHRPLSQWLKEKYEMLELLLGVDVCKKTHLSDIKTFNFSIPVVFRPCTFPMDLITGQRIDEYRNHFSYGSELFGLVPAATFWIVYGSVSAATMGTGYFFLAGAAGTLAERMISLVTPALSDKVYTKSCGGT